VAADYEVRLPGTDVGMSKSNEDRERLTEKATGRDPDEGDPSPGEPWAKTSSGDKESITDDEDDLLETPSLPGPDG
jgi:hypothetical protein